MVAFLPSLYPPRFLDKVLVFVQLLFLNVLVRFALRSHTLANPMTGENRQLATNEPVKFEE